MHYLKADETGGSYDVLPNGTGAYTISGNVLTIALAPPVYTAHGIAQLAVTLMKGTAEISTITII